MPATGKLVIQVSSPRLANAIASSLSPEIDHPAASKARVNVRVVRRKLELTFHARDATALRAIMNSYLRMIGACLKVTEAVENIR